MVEYKEKDMTWTAAKKATQNKTKWNAKVLDLCFARNYIMKCKEDDLSISQFSQRISQSVTHAATQAICPSVHLFLCLSVCLSVLVQRTVKCLCFF